MHNKISFGQKFELNIKYFLNLNVTNYSKKKFDYRESCYHFYINLFLVFSNFQMYYINILQCIIVYTYKQFMLKEVGLI